MAPEQLSPLKTTAIISGSFLSGAMASLSTISLPVLLDTTTHPPQLLAQWVRTYHYGHITLPSISIATAVLYFYIASCQRGHKKPWRQAALAGVMTVVIIPFTWVFMNPTNNVLFGLQRESQDVEGIATLEGVRGLVVKWGWLHLVRSLFPLVGGVVGYTICDY